MEVKNLKDLSKIITLCRKKGIESIKLGEIELKFGSEPIRPKRKNYKEDTSPELTEGTITDEDLLFWSSAGIPMGGQVNG